MSFFSNLFSSVSHSSTPRTSQATANLRLMTAEINHKLSRNQNLLKYTERAIIRAINEKDKNLLMDSAKRYVIVSREMKGMEMINYSISQVTGSVSSIMTSKSVPPQVTDHLTAVCCMADTLKFESFRNFRQKVLTPCLGKDIVYTLSNPTVLDQNVKQCFNNDNVTFDEMKNLIFEVVSHNYLDKSITEDLLGIPRSAVEIKYPSPSEVTGGNNLEQTNPIISTIQNSAPADESLTQPPKFTPPDYPNFQNASSNYPTLNQSDQINEQNINQTNASDISADSRRSNHLTLTNFTQLPEYIPIPENTPPSSADIPVIDIPIDAPLVTNNSSANNNSNNNSNSDTNLSDSVSSKTYVSAFSYKFNENLLPILSIGPFDKENYQFLADAVGAATDYKA